MPRSLILFIVAAALLLGTALADRSASSRTPYPLASPLDSISAKLAGWRAEGQQTLDSEVAQFLRANSYLSRTYSRDGNRLDFFVAFYESLRAGENLHTPRNCLPGTGWEPVDFGQVAVTTSGRTFHINKYVVQRDAARVLVFYWYQNPTRLYANEYMGKAYLLWDALSRNQASGSMVRVVLPDSPSAVRLGTEFAAAVIPEVQRCIGSAETAPADSRVARN